jgi:hypothetical protein
MADPVMVNGSLELQVDESGLEATIVFTPDPDGPQWDRQKISALLEERGIREGIQTTALDVVFDPEKSGSKRVITVARAREPQEGRSPELKVKTLSVPEALRPYETQVIPADRSPRVYQRTIEKTKT